MCFPFLGKATVTSQFGYRNLKVGSTDHMGVDLDLGSQTTVVSCVSGKVSKTGWNKYRGYYVIVAGIDHYSTIYQHLSKILVKEGETVYCKTPLGIEGATGEVSGPHLHFEACSTNDPEKSLSRKYCINPAIYWGLDNYYNLNGRILDGSGMILGNTTDSLRATVNVDYSSSSTGTSGVSSDEIIPSGEFYKVALEGTTGDWLYGRRYRVLIDLGKGNAFDVSNLRCKFEIRKTYSRFSNQCSVSIYNLNPDDENKLIKEGQRIVIEAGYNGSQYGKIFDGNIIQPVRSKEGNVDYKLTLISMDTDRYVTYGLVGVSLVAQQSMRQAINTLANKSSIAVNEGYISDQKINYPRGKVMFGAPTYYLDQIAKTMNASYYNENGAINVVKATDLPSDEILDIGPTSGLVGNTTQTLYGISFSCLLNPKLAINSLVHIDNRKISGYTYQQGNPVRSLDSEGVYRVISIVHSGDTRGDDWVTNVEAISQAGILPGMMVSNDISIF